MGSCISTVTAARPPKSSNTSGSRSSAANQNWTSKSPPLPEQETVKEVLSESPSIPRNQPPSFNQNYLNQIRLANAAWQKHHRRNGAVYGQPYRTQREHISVANPEIEENENNVAGNGELRDTLRRPPERFENGSFPGDVNREKTGGKYPVRRSDSGTNRVKSGFGYWRRGDSAGEEGSARRRSRSVVTATDLGSEPGGKTCRESGSGRETQKAEDKWPPTTNELLEMSLECFIFL